MENLYGPDDTLKHFVRKHCWLPACLQQLAIIRGRSKKVPLRYFTFCAVGAIDVFMLERDGIISRTEQDGRLSGVYFCEEKEEDFGRIAALIGSPEQGFQGTFDRIMLFKDDESTVGRTITDDTAYPPEVRKKLLVKDNHLRLRKSFPFDVINLDVCGVMFPLRKGVVTPLVMSLLKIFEWQTNTPFPITGKLCSKFTLMLTSHIDPDITDAAATCQLASRLSSNMGSHLPFQDAFKERFKHVDPGKLANEQFPEFFSLALPKYVMHEALYNHGWKITQGPTFLYSREDKYKPGKQYQMMHSAAVCERVEGFGNRIDVPNTGQYSEAIMSLIKSPVTWVNSTALSAEIVRELAIDFNSIIDFRDRAMERSNNG